MANHARILLLVGKEKEYNAYISSFVSLIVSCAYKPKGVIVGGARPSVYQFPCHLCSRSRPAGTLSIGVKPFHGTNTTQWLRFCAPLPPSSSSSSSASAPQGQEEQQLSCFESWDADASDDPALRPPRRSAALPRTDGLGIFINSMAAPGDSPATTGG